MQNPVRGIINIKKRQVNNLQWRCDTPPPLKRGISAILARYPLKTRQMGAIPPSAILSRKGIARYGGVSRTGPLRELCRKPNTLDGSMEHATEKL